MLITVLKKKGGVGGGGEQEARSLFQIRPSADNNRSLFGFVVLCKL